MHQVSNPGLSSTPQGLRSERDRSGDLARDRDRRSRIPARRRQPATRDVRVGVAFLPGTGQRRGSPHGTGRALHWVGGRRLRVGRGHDGGHRRRTSCGPATTGTGTSRRWPPRPADGIPGSVISWPHPWARTPCSVTSSSSGSTTAWPTWPDRPPSAPSVPAPAGAGWSDDPGSGRPRDRGGGGRRRPGWAGLRPGPGSGRRRVRGARGLGRCRRTCPDRRRRWLLARPGLPDPAHRLPRGAAPAGPRRPRSAHLRAWGRGTKRSVSLGEGLFVCGDHRDTASTQGALFSGGRAAIAVLSHLRGRPGPSSTA